MMMMCNSIDNGQEVSQELLYSEIATLWVTIGGFSFTNTWLEQYHTSKQYKAKGLRKELKRK